MGIISILFQWVGVVFVFGTAFLILRDNKKSMPTPQEKDFLIKCGAISVDCKDKKVLRKATREYRLTQSVLSELCLTQDEIAKLSKQAIQRKALQNQCNVEVEKEKSDKSDK